MTRMLSLYLDRDGAALADFDAFGRLSVDQKIVEIMACVETECERAELDGARRLATDLVAADTAPDTVDFIVREYLEHARRSRVQTLARARDEVRALVMEGI